MSSDRGVQRGTLQMGDCSVTDMTAVGKNEPSRDGSTSSIASSPEPEAETYTQEHPQTQKRKGGRKPVSSTTLPLCCKSQSPCLNSR